MNDKDYQKRLDEIGPQTKTGQLEALCRDMLKEIEKLEKENAIHGQQDSPADPCPECGTSYGSHKLSCSVPENTNDPDETAVDWERLEQETFQYPDSLLVGYILELHERMRSGAKLIDIILDEHVKPLEEQMDHVKRWLKLEQDRGEHSANRIEALENIHPEINGGRHG